MTAIHPISLTHYLLATLAAVVIGLPAIGADAPSQPPRPDDMPADMSKPVQVYILLGQSNCSASAKSAP